MSWVSSGDEKDAVSSGGPEAVASGGQALSDIIAREL